MGGEFGADPPGEAGTDLCGLGDGRPLGFLPGPVSLSEGCGSWGRIWGIWLWTRRAGMWRLCCSGAPLAVRSSGSMSRWAQRREQLHRLANNTRFLILPWMRVPHLASHVRGQWRGGLVPIGNGVYGHELDWLETFVEHERFAGSCYRAANWQCGGQTAGRSRQDRDHTQRVPIKDVYLYRLGGRGL